MKMMIHRLFYTLLVPVALAFAIAGCKRDEGNYDYIELNELVEIKDLPEELVAVYGMPLKVTPNATFSLDKDFDEADYDFEWTYIGPNGLGGTKLFSLAKTRSLDLNMTVAAGRYIAYYAITDRASGVKYTTEFVLRVVNEINEGWIMMNEANGQARVDMLSLNGLGEFDLIIDLLERTGSELQLEGKPVMTYTYNTGLLIGPDAISYGLYFGTDSYTTKVDPNTFKWTPTMGLTYEMFGQIPPGFYAEVIQQRGTWSSYMIGNNDVFFYNRTQQQYYSASLNYITAEEQRFDVAPFVGGNPNGGGVGLAVFYDMTNQRFVKHTGTNATSTIIPDPPADQKLFSFSTGMDLDYMRWVSYNGGEVFSILNEPNTGRKYLARFNPDNNAQSYYAEITGEGIAEAELYAVSPEFGYIFYAVGGKVYEYDMVYKTSKLMADYGSRKISYLNFYEFKALKYTDGNKLMVATYDPSKNDGTEGSLDIYTVPGINADLIRDASYSGFGRVTSLTYRER